VYIFLQTEEKHCWSYFAILAKPEWFNWSCDKGDTLKLMLVYHPPCHAT